MPSMMRRASAISSGVHWEKSFLRSTSRALKTQDVLGRRFELLVLAGVVGRLAVLDGEDRPLLRRLAARCLRRLLRSLLLRLASGRGGSPRSFWGQWTGSTGGPGWRQQRAPEAGELGVEDGDLLRAGDDAGAGGVVDVVVAEDVDRRRRRRPATGSGRSRSAARRRAVAGRRSAGWPGSTRRRSAAARAARRRVACSSRSRRSDLQQRAADEVGRDVAADAVDVLLVLQDDAEGVVDGLLVELDRAEGQQGAAPSRASRPCPAA